MQLKLTGHIPEWLGMRWPAERYALYGLPLLKATALKYGFPNEIGDDEGTESRYTEDTNDFNMYYDD